MMFRFHMMGVGALAGGTYRRAAASGFACLLISLTATSPAVAAPGRLDTSFGRHGIAGAILEPHYGQTAFDSVSEEVGGSLLAARRGIVRRYSSSGVLDASYAPTKQTFPEPVPPATQPDGKTLVNAGYNKVERLNPDGTPDQSFHGGKSEAVEMSIAAIAVLPSGKILVAGTAQYLSFLRTVEKRHAAVEALRGELAEAEQQRAPMEVEADLAGVWDDLSLEDRRRLLHSVFDSVFIWRTPDKGRKGKFPIAERSRLFLAGKGPPVPVRGRRGKIRTLALDEKR